ncbi:MAG: DUF3135 domain-containing protein [Chromatiales bacterium]|nr:DUF3135 domain-containing protein [Chromatiales bacterium]
MSDADRQTMDFEHWSTLASRDPVAFEQLRRELIEEVIDAASQRCQQRLRGLQWRIDQVREHSPSPMAACISLSNMMWDAFAGEDGLVETLNRRDSLYRRIRKEATIIPFPSPRQ